MISDAFVISTEPKTKLKNSWMILTKNTQLKAEPLTQNLNKL